jgi:molybdate transport system regulatory protein
MLMIGPLKLKIQLFCGDAPAIGPGKADLMDAIDHSGSISAAGRALGMSYRRAWMLVDEMNRCWTERLVETRSGGGKASGAWLTPTGRQVLQAYRQLEARIGEAAQGEALTALTAMMRPQPDAPKAEALIGDHPS